MTKSISFNNIVKGTDIAVSAGSALNSIQTEYGRDTADVFAGMYGSSVTPRRLTIGKREYQYVPWGVDDQAPYVIRRLLSENMITAQCQAFNILCCYGGGLQFVERESHQRVHNADISEFCMNNSLQELFMEQATDMKYWYFSVLAITLNRRGDKIVRLQHLDAMQCRIEYAPSTASGKSEHIFYGNFRQARISSDVRRYQVIPLLDTTAPLADLRERIRTNSKARTFAILTRMPTPGTDYYPQPYYMSALKDSWLDIYRLIGIGKRQLIKNTSAPRIQIEVHDEYFSSLCDAEGIVDPVKRKQRINEAKQQISDYITGSENAGKAIISPYRITPSGEERMVRFHTITEASKKEGGNWSDDMSEASNAICFAFGVHPNLVGATPGKSQMNNSGSDKRELFTLKQALERPFHDVMTKPYHLILHFNKWQDLCTVHIPMIQLTTLDKHVDSVEV